MLKNIKSPSLPERLIREIWKRQDFAEKPLITIDGKNVEIIFTGESNPNGGPDFLNAQIKIGGITFVGDVELHRHFTDWQQHTHHKDPKYNKVILHVVLYAHKTSALPITKSKRTVPTIVLEPYLSEELIRSLQENISNENIENVRYLKCFSINSNTPCNLIEEWLHKLAVQRLEYKIRRLEERLLELVQTKKVTEPAAAYGQIHFEVSPDEFPDFTPRYTQHDFTDVHLWEQVLYEFTMEALGYSKNQQPFMKLAKNVTLEFLDSVTDENTGKIIQYEAILFGVGGFLSTPGILKNHQSKEYLVQLKKVWKNVRESYNGETMTGAEWQFFRLRPENFPTIRIAAAARIVEKINSGNLFKVIVQLIENQAMGNTEKLRKLISLLTVEASGFWENHYRFNKEAAMRLKVLVGKDRAVEIIINIIIPLCLMYARVFKKKNVREMALKLFSEIKSSRNSAIVKTVEEQLVRGKFKLNTAPLYQGGVQLYKFYCVEEKCADCDVGIRLFNQ
ncbi:MAG: DUF2851 family protein [Bacteroidota bacterium]|nr:DUF2851 family protein [Bacteroidota bacterium]